MKTLPYIEAEKLWMQSDPDCTERWVQTTIANNPALLGLGHLVLIGSEIRQGKAGRLDLLLADSKSNTRYEVEIQLGATDASHIIRTIEYWDVEKRRYPQNDHIAVIVAEEITSRFFNVISLFNQAIPVIAIQMTALKVGDYRTLVFTKVLDIPSSRIDDMGGETVLVDRKYWEDSSTTAIMSAADSLLAAAKKIDSSTAFKFNKSYIGTTVGGSVSNFFYLTPQKRALRIGLHIEQNPEVERKIEESGVESDSYDVRYKNYQLRLTVPDVREKADFLGSLLKLAYDETEGDRSSNVDGPL